MRHNKVLSIKNLRYINKDFFRADIAITFHEKKSKLHNALIKKQTIGMQWSMYTKHQHKCIKKCDRC